MSGWRTRLLALISVHQRFFRKCSNLCQSRFNSCSDPERVGVHSTGSSLRGHGDGGKQPLRVPLLWFRAGLRRRNGWPCRPRPGAAAGRCAGPIGRARCLWPDTPDGSSGRHLRPSGPRTNDAAGAVRRETDSGRVVGDRRRSSKRGNRSRPVRLLCQRSIFPWSLGNRLAITLPLALGRLDARQQGLHAMAIDEAPSIASAVRGGKKIPITCRASRLLKMLGMLKRQMFVERAAKHPAGLMAEVFDLGEGRGGGPGPYFSWASRATSSSNFRRASVDSMDLSISFWESIPMVDSFPKMPDCPNRHEFYHPQPKSPIPTQPAQDRQEVHSCTPAP